MVLKYRNINDFSLSHTQLFKHTSHRAVVCRHSRIVFGRQRIHLLRVNSRERYKVKTLHLRRRLYSPFSSRVSLTEHLDCPRPVTAYSRVRVKTFEENGKGVKRKKNRDKNNRVKNKQTFSRPAVLDASQQSLWIHPRVLDRYTGFLYFSSPSVYSNYYYYYFLFFVLLLLLFFSSGFQQTNVHACKIAYTCGPAVQINCACIVHRYKQANVSKKANGTLKVFSSHSGRCGNMKSHIFRGFLFFYTLTETGNKRRTRIRAFVRF